MQREVKVVTVSHDSVNDEIRLRAAFGWTVAAASARSFATHADAAFVGAGGSHVFAGGGRMAMHNVHYVDLTLHRVPSPRNLQLAELERQYDAAGPQPVPRLGWNLFGWLLGGYLAAVLVAVVALENAPTSVAWGVGIVLGVGVTALLIAAWVRRRRRALASNQQAAATRQAILRRLQVRGT